LPIECLRTDDVQDPPPLFAPAKPIHPSFRATYDTETTERGATTPFASSIGPELNSGPESVILEKCER
jgi:hypothetical protein